MQVMLFLGMDTLCQQFGASTIPFLLSTTAAASVVSSDQQKQHLQQLLWKEAAPVPEVAAGPE